jgi:hypothetical protein
MDGCSRLNPIGDPSGDGRHAFLKLGGQGRLQQADQTRIVPEPGQPGFWPVSIHLRLSFIFLAGAACYA